MGIFRDLVSNVAQAEAQKRQQQTAQNLAWGDILTTLIQNPATDDATYQKAAGLYHDLLGSKGGKTGKELQGQIAQFLGAYGAQRRQARAQQGIMDRGGTQPAQGQVNTPPTTGDVDAQGNPVYPPVPPGQSMATGVNYGWSTGGATPATAAGTGGAGAQDGRQGGDDVPEQPGAGRAPRHGFGKVLGGLAGVGKEMLGMPSSAGGMIPNAAQIQRMYGPTGMETAQEKEREAISVGRMDEQEYERQQQQLVGRGLQSQADADENVREFVRQGGKAPSGRAEEAQTLSTIERKSTGEIIPVWVSKRGQRMETLDHKPIDMSDVRAVGTPVNPKFTGRMAEREQIRRIKEDPNSTPSQKADAEAEEKYMNIQAESAASMAQIRSRQIQSASAIVPGTDEFTIAQNLAYGDLTFDAFNRMLGYREAGRKEAVYVKAKMINPYFSQSAFEAGFRFYMRPQTRQQLASLDNVEAALTDMIRFSDDAKRSSLPLMNKFELPAGYMFGNRAIANFNLALVAFSDELAGALGAGANTDMTRRMGKEMSDGNVDPETFRKNLQIVAGFLGRKRDSLLGEMGPYGQPGGTTPVMRNKKEYDALPPGAPWRKPSDKPGTVRTKPYPDENQDQNQ